MAIFAGMKPAQIFHQYIWIINTLRAYGKLTLEELKQKWQDDSVANGKPLQRSSFNRHRDAILNMFGIIIDCNLITYEYYISNEEVLSDDSIERWLFSTLTVHGMLTDETPMAHVVVRAHDRTSNYLRMLPLHHSQREIASTEHYADFSFDIRPTVDFQNELMKYGDGIEVLEPLELREKMRQMLQDILKRYE